MSHPVAEYLHELYLISGVSVPGTSGYPALSKLLNAVGDTLKPKITAVIHPSNNGAGIPDGGLFSSKELKKHGPDSPGLFQLKPERGVIEVKSLEADLSSFESSAQVRNYLEHYGQILLTKCGAEDLFFHIAAVLHAPLYREENAGALRQDWPRVPLPKTAQVLQAGAALGRQIAALPDPETPAEGVTTLKVRPDLQGLGELAVKEGSTGVPPVKSEKAHGQDARAPFPPDLAIAARWGYAGQGGVTMPGPGMIRSGTRGEGYLDIHLNDTTRWKDVPEPVGNYTLGGYQVLKKWLSYCGSALPARPLTPDEAQQFTHHVRASPASSLCTGSWMRTTGRVFDLFPRNPNLHP